MKQKIYKLISMVLAVALIVSCCTVALSVTAEDTAKEPITYYVSPEGEDGDGRGLEVDKPLASVNAAVLAAKEANYGAGDTVNVKVVYVEGKSAYLNTAESNILIDYKFALNISSATDVKASVGVANKGFHLTGSLKADNIILNIGNNTASWPLVAIGNNDFYVGKNVSITGGSNFDFGMRGSAIGSNFSKDMTIYFGTQIKSDLAQSVYHAPTYNGDLTIIYDNASSNTFSFTTSNYSETEKRTTTYNSNVNFVVNSASAFTLKAPGYYSFAVGKAIQLINNSSINVSSAVSVISSMKDKEGGSVPYYVYSNSTGKANAMEVTDTVGKIKVNLNPDEYDYIGLVNVNNESINADIDNNGYITVSEPGEYVLKAHKSIIYYVGADGNDDNPGTKSLPLASVDKAVNLANSAGYTEGDTVYVKVIYKKDTLVTWTTDTSNKITPHKFTLNLSTDGGTVATVGTSNKTYFNGPTILSNVKLAWNNWGSADFPPCDFVVGENVSTTSTNYNYYHITSGTYSGNINFVMKSRLKKDLNVGGDYSAPTYTETANLNITYDGSATYGLNVGSRSGNNNTGAHALKVNGNINFNLKSVGALTLTFPNDTCKVRYGNNSAVQIINSIGADSSVWETALTTNVDLAKPAKYYIIDNKSGNKEALSFTDIAGKYKVNLSSDVYDDISIVNKSNNTIVPIDENGFVTLTESGVYTFNATKKSNLSVTYYISADGYDKYNDGKNKAVKSIAKIVELANAAGYGKGDNVYVKANGDIEWGVPDAQPGAYAYTLHIETEKSATSKATVNVGTVTGNLVFDNIELTNSSTICLNGYSITLGKNVITRTSANFDLVGVSQTVYETQNVIINNKYEADIVVGNNSQGSSTWKKDVNIIFNNAAATPEFSFKVYWAGTNTINGNLNFILNKVASATFNPPNGQHEPSGSVRKWYTVVGGAVQIVIPEDVVITRKENITNWVTENSYKYYEVVKSSGVQANLEPNEEAGKFKVDIDTDVYKDIKLINNSDQSSDELNEGIVTAASSGVYTFEAAKKSNIVGTYFVSPNGDDDNNGKTVGEPLSSINGVIAAASADGYGVGDTVCVKLIKTFDKTGAEIKHSWFTANNEPSADTKPLTKYLFKLSIGSYTDKASIDMSKSISLNGLTNFENVILAFPSKGTPNFNFYANDVSFSADTEYVNGGNVQLMASWVSALPEELNYYFESLPSSLYLGGNCTPQTFKNINITLDKGFAKGFVFGDRGYESGAITTFNGILNFNIKDATALTLSNTNYGPVVFDKNFVAQFINSTGNASLTNKAIEYLKTQIVKDTETVVPYYVINNNTGDKEAISFTETAGKYQLNIDTKIYDVKVLNSSKEDITATVLTNDGCIDLVSAGLVSDTFTVIALNQNGSVDENGYVVFDICDLVKADENAVSADAIAYIRKELLNK